METENSEGTTSSEERLALDRERFEFEKTDAKRVFELNNMLEQQRLQLEKDRARRESSFLNKHFPAILTATVSLMAILVTNWQADSTQRFRISAMKIEAETKYELSANELLRRNQENLTNFITKNREGPQGYLWVKKA